MAGSEGSIRVSVAIAIGIEIPGEGIYGVFIDLTVTVVVDAITVFEGPGVVVGVGIITFFAGGKGIAI